MVFLSTDQVVNGTVLGSTSVLVAVTVIVSRVVVSSDFSSFVDSFSDFSCDAIKCVPAKIPAV